MNKSHGSKLEPTIHIFVKSDNKIMGFDVKESDTVCDLKRMIHERDHILLPDRQILLRSSREIEDHRPLADYRIHRDATIHVHMRFRRTEPCTFCRMDLMKKEGSGRKEEPKIEIFVNSPSSKILAFEVKGSDTIYALKCMIYGRDFIPPHEQRLTFSTKWLEDHLTMADCGVLQHSTFQVLLRLRGCVTEPCFMSPAHSYNQDKTIGRKDLMKKENSGRKEEPKIKIFVNSLSSKIMTFEVKGSDTIYALKCMIYGRDFIPVHEQRLTFSTKWLEDHLTMAHYRVHRDSTFRVLLRLRSCDPGSCFMSPAHSYNQDKTIGREI
ncbi:PREDICTED: polyubiquitin 11-like isoform X2 [Tarenaya hassleriana]|uniref:polyubiquitin 11-like isoform X2 n=1 Tax=Tarenaya hassleriana TaxID=28532 RepID=UPI00053C6F51|nr:PREDICTED: polyubiquitin 11-like isoform X2 [Tarenaya hassleriana]